MESIDGNAERFEKGDILKIRGYKHKVKDVLFSPSEDAVVHYKIDPLDEKAPPSTLEPVGDGFVVKEHHVCKPEKVGENK